MTFNWLELLRSHTDRFAAIVGDADRAASVTFCPGWTIGDLAVHLGGVHRWAAHAVVEGNPKLEPEPIDPAGPGLPAWYRHQAVRLLDVLTATPADAHAWTLDHDDPTAGFWQRRQVHETVMHLWDAQQALGEPASIDPALAWDGVLEVCDVMYPRQLRLGRAEPLASAVHLAATDVEGDVTIGDGDAVEIHERAEVLLRLLWHRVDVASELTDPAAAVLASAVMTP